MNTIVKEQAILALTPHEDHTAKEGCFVLFSSGTAALSTSATDEVIGVIVDGDVTTGMSAVALNGAFSGIVKVMLHSTVNQGDYLVLSTDGTVYTDPGTGARRRVARALESGNASELVNAVLMTPLALS